MAYPHPTFHRSDSQSVLYKATQQQGSAANTGHQNQQARQGYQSHPSRPHLDSKSSSSLANPRRELTEFYGTEVEDDVWDEAFDHSKKSVEQLKQSINSINHGDLDIDALINLFGDIKNVQKRGDPSRIRREAPDLLSSLSKSVGVLLKKINDDIQSDMSVINSLNAEDIHILFNGLSALVGESANESLLSKSDFNKAKSYLRHVTEHLLVRASEKNFFQEQWDSSSLINVLNWLSRSLKQGILSVESSTLRRSFTQALILMKDWAPGAGEIAGATTLKAPLDTRQLGKCMVQVATALKFGLVTEDAPDNLLRDVVLGLCGGKALTQCTLWQQGSDSSSSSRVLTPVQPDGAELTNISNTVKDGLHAGILSLEQAPVQSLINALCRHMNTISEDKLMERHGQRLGNSCNFLREIFEIEHVAGPPVLKDRAEYDKACKRMLEQISRLSPLAQLSVQSIANLLSFVKAMDRTRSQPTEVLREAASHLLTHLSPVIGQMKAVESITGTLGGLQHLGLRGLISVDLARDLMISVLTTIDLADLARWPVKSRTVLIQAAMHCLQGLSEQKKPMSEPCLLGLMDRLLALPEKATDPYPYVMAASVLMKRDSAWLNNHQPILSQLIPTKAGTLISAADVLVELAQLKVGEPVIEAVVPPTTTTTAITTEAMTTATAQTLKAPQQRVPVGMTRVIEPARSAATTTNITKATATNVLPKTISAVVGASVDSWQSPNRVAKAKKGETALLASTEPKLVSRDKSAAGTKLVAEKKSSADKKPANQPKKTSAFQKSVNKPVAKPSASNKVPKLTPEQEWFQLLKQEKSLSVSQVQRLQTLLEATPRLAVAVEGKGPKDRSALFYALSTGKVEAVRLIMSAGTPPGLEEILRQVFVETLMVGDAEAEALTFCLSSLSAEKFNALRENFATTKQAESFEKTMPKRLFNVLTNIGLLSPKVSDSGTEKQPITPDKNPLITAILERNKQEVARLLKSPSVTSMSTTADRGGMIPLIHAIKSGQTEVVRSLLSLDSANEQVMQGDAQKRHALCHAALNGRADMVDLLLGLNSADKQAKKCDDLGENALILAIADGHLEIVKSLLNLSSAQDQLAAINVFGFTSLHLAIQSRHLEIIDLLLDQPSIDAQLLVPSKREGKIALMYAIEQGLTQVALDLLSFASADAQARAVFQYGGSNALMLAVVFGNIDIVNALLSLESAGEQLKAKDINGHSAIDLASVFQRAAIMARLIQSEKIKREGVLPSETEASAEIQRPPETPATKHDNTALAKQDTNQH